MKNHSRLFFSLVLCMVLVPFTVHTIEPIPAKPSAERYVSTGGSNVGDCTSISCKTIQYAVNVSNPDDTIHVAAGTYTQAGITVDGDLTILGEGADKTIIQAAATRQEASDRVLDITPGHEVIIKDLTIKNGNVTGSGGGIRVDKSSLTLIDATIEFNVAAGTSNSNGGGIEVRNGWLTLDACTINDNTASNAGGGIYLYYSSANILNTTFQFNRAFVKGGAVGTLSDEPKTILVAYTTISTNSGGDYGGGMQVESTFTVNLSNVIVAHNSAYNGSDIYGKVNSQDYNLFLSTEDAAITGITTHNITGQDAGVGVLEYHGGSTRTLALMPSSPAIDAGKCDGVTTDQRGFPRPVNITGVENIADGCDIGAYEVDIKVALPLVNKSN